MSEQEPNRRSSRSCLIHGSKHLLVNIALGVSSVYLSVEIGHVALAIVLVAAGAFWGMLKRRTNREFLKFLRDYKREFLRVHKGGSHDIKRTSLTPMLMPSLLVLLSFLGLALFPQMGTLPPFWAIGFVAGASLLLFWSSEITVVLI